MDSPMPANSPFGQGIPTIRQSSRPSASHILVGVDYDTKRLAALGKRMQRLREDVDALRPQLAEEILAALRPGCARWKLSR
jgi:hypothetical protein